MGFEWLGLTPAATAALNADPALFVDLILVIVGLAAMGVIIWYINYETGKQYRKPKVKKDAKGGKK